jgi:hypothetical protein
MMIQAKAVHLFLLLIGSHGDGLGRFVEADGKNKASAVQLDRLLDEEAIPSLKKGPPWSDFDGASATYSGPGPPNLLSEDKEAHLLLDEEAMPFTNEDQPWSDLLVRDDDDVLLFLFIHFWSASFNPNQEEHTVEGRTE